MCYFLSAQLSHVRIGKAAVGGGAREARRDRYKVQALRDVQLSARCRAPADHAKGC